MSLEELRAKIDEIDYQILYLISQRFLISRKIAEIKNRLGLSIKDEAREAEVLRNWVENSRRLGVPEELARELVNSILNYSKRVQLTNSSPKRVTIVGYGGMGKALAKLLTLAEHKVVITGRNSAKAEEAARESGSVYMPQSEALEWGDYVILALPPEAIKGDYFSSLKTALRGKTVMDILSVKGDNFDFLERVSVEESFRFVSTHPLFGPHSSPIGEEIVVIPSKTSGDISDVIAFWRSAGLNVVVSDPEKHDKAMAVVQVLSHFYLLALKESYDKLARVLGVEKEVEAMRTVTFKDLMRVINRVISQEDVVMEIQNDNPYAYIARRIGIEAISELFARLGGNALHPQEGGGLVDPKREDKQ
jgi:chorismate mutase/prephenate dehydrogenase